MVTTGPLDRCVHPVLSMWGATAYAHVWGKRTVSCLRRLAAVDVYLEQRKFRNRSCQQLSGEFNYGGAHVIEDFAAAICCWGESYGTDCYPRPGIKGNYPGGNE